MFLNSDVERAVSFRKDIKSGSKRYYRRPWKFVEKLDGWTEVCRRRQCGYYTKWPAVLSLLHIHAGPIHHPGG